MVIAVKGTVRENGVMWVDDWSPAGLPPSPTRSLSHQVIYILKRVHTNRQMYKYTNVQIHIYRYSIIQIYKCTHIQIDKYTNIQIHKYTNLQMYK